MEHAPRSKRRRLSAEEKLTVIKVARTRSIQAACTRFGVSGSSISEWSKQEMALRARSPLSKQASRPAPPAETQHSAAQMVFLPTAGSNNTGDVSNSTTTGVTQETTASAISRQSGNTQDDGPRAVQHLPSNEARQSVINHASSSNESPRTFLIGIHGEQGGFGNIAAQRTFFELQNGNELQDYAFELTGFAQVVHMLEALGNEDIDFGFVPTEVLLSSASHVALNRVISLRLRLMAEITCGEHISVCGLPVTDVRDADCIMSDMDVLSRCEEHIIQLESQHNHMIHHLIVWDSATGCRLLREEQFPKTLVLCSKEAARVHGLVVIQENVSTAKSQSKYTIIGRQDATDLAFPSQRILSNPAASRQQSTVVSFSAGRTDLFDVVSAFTNLNLLIEHFSLRNNGDEPTRTGQLCVVSYRAGFHAVVEATLDRELTAIAERVVYLGKYVTHILGSQT